MKNWLPDMSNGVGPLTKGPATRRLGRPRRRRAKYTLSILARLSGDRFARWATRAARWHRRPGIAVRYEPDSGLYLVTDTETHAFAHPKRLWTLFDGQNARGRRIAYEYLLDQVSFQKGDRIIDVGANTGDLALAFRAIDCPIHIEAFEPSPGEFAALQRNLAACSAVIDHRAHQVALWHESSDGLTFYLKPRKGDSSLIPINGATGTISVPGRRLDEALPPGGTRYRLLKLEAEGAEPEILQGARRLLPIIDYITVDVGFERGAESLSTLPEVANILLGHGFRIVGYEGGRHVLLFENTRPAE